MNYELKMGTKKQGTDTGKIEKLLYSKFVEKDKLRTNLLGIYYHDGKRFASNGYLLAIVETPYDEDLENKLIDKDGNQINACPVSYESVFPAPDREPDVNLTPERIQLLKALPGKLPKEKKKIILCEVSNQPLHADASHIKTVFSLFQLMDETPEVRVYFYDATAANGNRDHHFIVTFKSDRVRVLMYAGVAYSLPEYCYDFHSCFTDSDLPEKVKDERPEEEKLLERLEPFLYRNFTDRYSGYNSTDCIYYKGGFLFATDSYVAALVPASYGEDKENGVIDRYGEHHDCRRPNSEAVHRYFSPDSSPVCILPTERVRLLEDCLKCIPKEIEFMALYEFDGIVYYFKADQLRRLTSLFKLLKKIPTVAIYKTDREGTDVILLCADGYKALTTKATPDAEEEKNGVYYFYLM